MNRSVLEEIRIASSKAWPSALTRWVQVAASCISAAEYGLAVKRLHIAIEQAYKYGLLGKQLFGTNFDFDVEVAHRRGRIRLRRGNGSDAFGPKGVAANRSPVPPSPPTRSVGQTDEY